MGYSNYPVILSKFKKPFLHPTWNGLFTLLFKSILERISGSDNESKLFCPIIYGLYNGINLDYGSILWSQLVQITLSTTRHSEILCARFWSVIVRSAINRLNILVIEGCIMEAIPIFQNSSFIKYDPMKFAITRSLP